MPKMEVAKIESFFSPRRKEACTQSDLTLTLLTSLEARAGESHETTLLRQVSLPPYIQCHLLPIYSALVN